MKIYFDKEGSLAGLVDNVAKALKDGAGGLVVLSCEGNNFEPSSLNPLLKSVGAPLIGGIFPNVLYGGEVYHHGSVILGFEGFVSTSVINSLSSEETDLEGALEKFEDRSSGARTMMVFVDGFSSRITPFISSLFDIFGLEINYIGGGAGSLSKKNGPCLFSNSGMIEDGAVMALVDTISGVGVAHGWQPMSAPMQATQTHGTELKTIEFEPAFDIYSSIVKRHTGVPIDRSDFQNQSMGHPFGIARIGREMIIRDPLIVKPDGSLICAGEIPENSYISIMHGNEKTLLVAAESAGRMAVAALPEKKPGSFILIDCISRLMFLKGHFKDELAKMTPLDCPSAGACTIGEIANSGADFLEFYNKTAVVAAMESK